MTTIKTDIFDRNFEDNGLDPFEYTFINKAKTCGDSTKFEKSHFSKQVYLQCKRGFEENPNSIFKIYDSQGYSDQGMTLKTSDGITQLVDSARLKFDRQKLEFYTNPYFDDLPTLTCKNVVSSLELFDENNSYCMFGDTNNMELTIDNNTMSVGGSTRKIAGCMNAKLRCNFRNLEEEIYHKYLLDYKNGVRDVGRTPASIKNIKIKFEQQESDKNLYVFIEGIVDTDKTSSGYLEMECGRVDIMIRFD